MPRLAFVLSLLVCAPVAAERPTGPGDPGLDPDLDAALELVPPLADAGQASVQYELAERYYRRGSRGEPVPERACVEACSAAFERCSRASASTDGCLVSAVACARACPLENRVVGVPDDYLRAFAWADLAAAQDHPAALRRRQYFLYLLRFEGRHQAALALRRQLERWIATHRAQ